MFLSSYFNHFESKLSNMPRVKYASTSGSRKRRRISAGEASSKRLSIPRMPSNKSIVIARTFQYDLTCSSDAGVAFTFQPQGINVYHSIAGGSVVATPGLSDIENLFEMMRVARVDVRVCPTAISEDYSTGQVSSQLRGVPLLYHGQDPRAETASAPTLAQMQENCFTKVVMLDGMKTLKIYPKADFGAGAGIVDIGLSQKSRFVKPSNTTVYWSGYNVYLDNVSNSAYNQVRFIFTVHFECMFTK